MKNNTIDFVVGPIESYEDKLFGYKASHEAYILIKDKDWSNRLVKYAALLPDLQKDLPCEQKYKDETPGSDSDLMLMMPFIMPAIVMPEVKPLPLIYLMTKK